MSAELKPCPFCGGKAHNTYVSDFRISSPRTGRRVACGQCSMQSGTFGTEHEAIEAWNRRTAIQQAAGAVPEDLRDRLLSALERAAAAESALRALVDECDNDKVAGWEERMAACIDNANRLLAASPTPPAGGSSDHLVPCAGDRVQVPLTVKQIDAAARDAQIAFCLEKYSSFELAFTRKIEAAHGINAPAPRPDAPTGQIKIRTYCEDCGKPVSDEPDGIHTCSPQYGKPLSSNGGREGVCR